MFGFAKKKKQSSLGDCRRHLDFCVMEWRSRCNPYGFVPGCAYVANSTPKCPDQQIVVMAGGRDSGGRMTFVRVGGIASGQVETFDGRETVKIRFDDGSEFFVSSAVPADVDEASRVMGMIRWK